MIDKGSEFKPRQQISKPNFRGKCSVCGREEFLVGGRCLTCYQLKSYEDQERFNKLRQVFEQRWLHPEIDFRGYGEIIKLHSWLLYCEIPHSYEPLYDGFQILYPTRANPRLSIVEHFGSYGSEVDLLEVMDYRDGSVKGFLTEANVSHIISKMSRIPERANGSALF